MQASRNGHERAITGQGRDSSGGTLAMRVVRGVKGDLPGMTVVNRLLRLVALAGVAACDGCAHPWADLGQVNHHYVVTTPLIDDREFGKSSGAPVALRIPVGNDAAGDLGYVGRLVHQELFTNYPSFDFTVAFASAHVDFWGHSEYADPASIWYNVFFGFYEIDAPVDTWSRPFGYAGPKEDAAPVPDDVVLIGKADWNFFSNHLYGVPLEAIHNCCLNSPPPVVTVLGRVALPSGDKTRSWDDLDVHGVTVVGPNRSTVDHGRFEHPHSATDAARPAGIDDVWRRAFGTHAPTDTPARSFQAANLRARILMFHDRAVVRGRDVYRTFLFGGTVGENVADQSRAQRFLDLQITALKKVMRGTGLGF